MRLTKVDPQRLTLVRRSFLKLVESRFGELESRITATIGDQNSLGLGLESQESLISNTIWADLPKDQKTRAFTTWLEDNFDETVLKLDTFTGEHFSQGFINRAYVTARKRIEKGRPLTFGVSTSQIRFLSERTFEEILGVKASARKRLRFLVADALISNESSKVLTRKMVDELGIERKRALKIARTELSRAYAEGQLDAFESQGITEVQAKVEFTTARDDRVCPVCAALEGEIMSISVARGIIPVHPNCRCAWAPYVPPPKKKRRRRRRRS